LSRMGRTSRGGGVAGRGGTGPRRGTILLVVLVIITVAALTGTTVMYLGEAGMSAEGVALKRIQSRSLAWSGVQAVMADLADQRDTLLDGGAPVLEGQWELFSDSTGTRGIVRLMDLGQGKTAVSEASKLDINTATAEMLGRIPGMTPEIAQAVVAFRSARRFASVDDLLRVKGVTPEMLRGSPPGQDRLLDPAEGAEPPARLADLLTVFSFDPNIQSGLGDGGSEHRGNLRVNLNIEWSDRLAAALDQRFGDGASRAVKSLLDRGTTFKTCGDVVNAANTVGVGASEWATILDALTVSDDPYILGRVDLNTASAEVLAAIPGISKESAALIVQAREGLSDGERISVAWPAAQGIIATEDFVKAVDHLTTRSMQWRVRVEAGTVSRDTSGGAEQLDEVVLSDRMVLEAVIDVSSERPRIAYLRDVTLEELAGALRASIPPVPEVAKDPGIEEAAPESSPSPPAGASPITSGGSMSSGGGSKLTARKPPDPIQRTPPTGGAQPGPPAPPDTGAEPPAQGVDRRLGRWTTGATGTGAGR